MDQATPTDKVVLRNFSQCREEQIWIGLYIYPLVAITKKRFGIHCSLYTLLQILEVNIFEKKPIPFVVAEALKQTLETSFVGNQLTLLNN